MWFNLWIEYAFEVSLFESECEVCFDYYRISEHDYSPVRSIEQSIPSKPMAQSHAFPSFVPIELHQTRKFHLI